MLSRFKKLNRMKLTAVAFLLLLSTYTMHSCSSSSADTADMISIPINFTKIANASSSLDLVSTATNINVFVGGCASGFRTNGTAITSGSTINIPNRDKNCLVELISFTLGSTVYSTVGANASGFTTWLANDVATFQSTTTPTDLIQVFVISQVTQANVLATDTVSYKFTDTSALSTSNLGQASIVYSRTVSVTGDASPNFTLAHNNILAFNADGSYNMGFSLLCGSNVTGTTPNFSCSGVQMNTQLDYILIPDTYSQAPLTIAQLTTAFTSNTPTAVGSSVVGVSGTDVYGYASTHGGFYTSNSTPLVTSAPVYPSNTSYVFAIRQKDSTVTNVQSYTYYYVVFPASSGTTSACGTYFAGGSGTSGDPYQVDSPLTLANTALCTTSTTFFIQVNNIDLSGLTWTPIAMSGQYNGGNFTISNLTVSTSSAASVDGLFSTIKSSASVSNLNLMNVSIASQGINVGTLAGTTSGTITNVEVQSGSITHTFAQAANGTSAVGGLVGNMSTGSSIASSSSAASITSTDTAVTTGNTYNLGGLVGASTVPSISSSFATGNVTIASASATARTVNMGTLVGAVSTGTGASITQCFATGNLTFPTGGTSTTLRMGMVGIFAPTSGAISYSFATGTYTSSSATTIAIGGMVGVLTSPGTVNNSYTKVSFVTTGTTAGNLGGFVGTTSTTNLVSLSYSADPSFSSTITTRNVFNGSGTAVLTSYYYNGATGLPAGTTAGATTESSANMQLQGTFTSLTFGSAATQWVMPTSTYDGFLSPGLNWQCSSTWFACSAGTHPTFNNGDFEIGNVIGSTVIPAGSGGLSGWTIGGDSVDVDSSGVFNASSGTYSVDLSGNTAGSISQVLSTVSGTTYAVSFDLAANPLCGNSGIKTMYVTAANQISFYSFDSTGHTTTSMGWTTQTFYFVATSSSTLISFVSTIFSTCGPVIDNVR